MMNIIQHSVFSYTCRGNGITLPKDSLNYYLSWCLIEYKSEYKTEIYKSDWYIQNIDIYKTEIYKFVYIRLMYIRNTSKTPTIGYLEDE